MENLWVTYRRGMGKGWRTPYGGGIRQKELGIRRLTSCAASLVVIPTAGRELWQAEKAGMGKGQRRAPSWQQSHSTTHRSFQDDKARGITEQGKPHSSANQVPPCGRDDKAIVRTGRYGGDK
jgi:hypothetical protein